MHAERRLGDDFQSAGSHHAQAPNGKLQGLGIDVAGSVAHGDTGRGGIHQNAEGLQNPPARILGRVDHHLAGLGVLAVLHRVVVEMIGSHRILRRDPEAVPAANHPFRLAATTEFVGVGFENIPPAGCRKMQNARTDIEGGDEFEMAICEM